MAIKKLRALFLTACVLSFFNGCTKYYASDKDNDNTPSGSEDAADYTWNTSDVVRIVLNGTSVTENSDSVSVEGTKVTITSGGNYSISGNLSDGQIIVYTDDENIVRLGLDGVEINCSSGSPVFVKKAVKVMIMTGDGTENYLTDGTAYETDSDGEPNAAVFSKSYLSFYGTGSLIVKGNYNDGITSKDGMVIKEGNITVTAVDDGIRGKDYIEVKRGTLTVNAGGDGLKSDNDTDSEYGYIRIGSGTFRITAAGDGLDAVSDITVERGSFSIITGGGVSASGTKGGPPPGGGGGSTGGYTGTVSAKGIKSDSNIDLINGSFMISSADDALHAANEVTIGAGSFTVSSGDDAIHAAGAVTLSPDSLNILTSYEGIESASITYKSGFTSMVASDDGFNSTMGSPSESDDGSRLKILGGNILINCSGGDGIDSNGSVEMTGGTVIVHGPASQPEVGIDVNGSFNISGGLLLASGPNSGNMIEATSTTSSQYAVKVTIQSTITSSTLFHIQNSDGKDLITYKPVRSVYYVVFSSADLTPGGYYSVYTGGSSTGTLHNGIYTGGIYSDGMLRKDFTISGKVTNVSF